MKLDFYAGIRLNSTLRFLILRRWESIATRPGGWLGFSTIDPPKAKARQRFKLCGWNRFDAKHPV